VNAQSCPDPVGLTRGRSQTLAAVRYDQRAKAAQRIRWRRACARHADYHNPGDDWEKIDGPGLERGAGTPPRPPGEQTSRGYGAYLGSVQDFTPVERGVKLSGVTPGSPAERAALRARDIILPGPGRSRCRRPAGMDGRIACTASG
jgi:hypothetical protein